MKLQKFTDDIVRGLELPDGADDDIAWNPRLPGHGVRIRRNRRDRQRFSRSFIVQYRTKDGEQRRESQGDTRKLSVKAAETAARKRFAEIQLGQDPVGERRKARQAAGRVLTLGKSMKNYLAIKQRAWRPRTEAAIRRYLMGRWQPLHDRPLAEITRAQIAAVLQRLIVERGAVSAGRARDALRAFYIWAIGEGLVEASPVLGTNRPDSHVRPRQRVLSDDELAAIWKACEDGSDHSIIMRLLVLSGARKNEIAGLRWSELDLETGELIVPPERVKTNAPLELRLPPAAVELLHKVERRDGRECLFGQRAASGFTAWSMWNMKLNHRIELARGAPLAPWVVHDIRRSVRSGLSRIGIAPHISELVLNHQRVGIERVYDRYSYAAEKAQALLRWSDHVMSLVENRPPRVQTLDGRRKRQDAGMRRA
jgi:integrase